MLSYPWAIKNTVMGNPKPCYFPLKEITLQKIVSSLCCFQYISRNSFLLPFHSSYLLRSRIPKTQFHLEGSIYKSYVNLKIFLFSPFCLSPKFVKVVYSVRNKGTHGPIFSLRLIKLSSLLNMSQLRKFCSDTQVPQSEFEIIWFYFCHTHRLRD